jgi:integrase
LHCSGNSEEAGRRQVQGRDAWIDNGLIFTTRHGTRKICATLLAALDVHPRVAMRILRHSKVNVTMEIYTEAPSEAPSEATVEALRMLSKQLAT